MNSRGGWLRILIILGVIWTGVVAIMGWLNLPRAEYIPHNPEFLNRLSNEAAAIIVGSIPKPKPSGGGALIWTDVPLYVSMPNRARLTFPIATTSQEIALVRNEYLKLLQAEAAAQTGPHVWRLILAWLLPLPIMVVLGLAAALIRRAYRCAFQNGIPEPITAGWTGTSMLARPLVAANPPDREPTWKWRFADRHAEHRV